MILQKIVGFDFWKAFFFKVAKYQLITIQVIFQIIKNGQREFPAVSYSRRQEAR